MKKEVLFIIAFLLATTVYADCDLTETINEGLHITPTVEGKYYNISFTSYINGSAKFKVKGVSTSDLDAGMKHSFDDLSDLTLQSITGPSGNSTAEICFNAGLSGKKGTCSSTLECDDSNPCTIDECDGDPLRCHHKLILWCRDGDGCCPESRCTSENDNDCDIVANETTGTGTRCTNSSDCDDNDPFTIDTCGNRSRRCSYTTIAECLSGDDFCPENCTYAEDTDCDECSIGEDCNDGIVCTSDTCSGSPKRCFNNITLGCDLNGECVSVGTRTEEKFCNSDNTMDPLRSGRKDCDNNYECKSNECIENKCKGTGFFKGIISWFKGLFGR